MSTFEICTVNAPKHLKLLSTPNEITYCLVGNEGKNK